MILKIKFKVWVESNSKNQLVLQANGVYYQTKQISIPWVYIISSQCGNTNITFSCTLNRLYRPMNSLINVCGVQKYLDKSVASFCHQVAAHVPDILCNFYSVKNHKISNTPTTTKAIKLAHFWNPQNFRKILTYVD